MATNYTTNYDLCQWQPTHPVIRTDFNADNAKLEAALTALEEAKTRLDRVTVNLAYHTGRLALQNLLKNNVSPTQRAIICETFRSSADKALTGGAVIQNNTLTLSGQNKTGQMTASSLSVFTPGWTQARLWVHFSGGSVTPTLNGNPMECTETEYTSSAAGTLGWEQEFTWNGTGASSAQIALTLSTGAAQSMTVYDYCVVFF